MEELSPENCTCYKLRLASRHVTQIFDKELASVKLRSTQFSILATIAEMDSERVSDIAKNLNMDRTTLTRNISPLERDGYLRSFIGETDAREKRLQLTPDGQTKLAEAKENGKVSSNN